MERKIEFLTKHIKETEKVCRIELVKAYVLRNTKRETKRETKRKQKEKVENRKK